MKKKSQESSTHWIVLFLLSFVGLVLAMQAEFTHVQLYTNPSFKSGCNINSHFNCESVAVSPYAVFLNVPVAVWGILLSMVFLGISWRAIRQKEEEVKGTIGFLFLVSSLSVIGSIALAYISKTKIGTFCTYCVGTYLVNLFCFLLAFVAMKKANTGIVEALGCFLQDIRSSFLFYGWPVVFVLCLPLLFTTRPSLQYWKIDFSLDLKDIHHGVTDKGEHWIGAKNPKLTIVEFSDYQCPYCSVGHNLLRAKYLSKYKDQIRLVHKNLPLDQACNPNIKRKFHAHACFFAKTALCAGKQNKFWEMNDLIFKGQKRLNPNTLLLFAGKMKLNIAQLTTCVQSKEIHDEIQKDIVEAKSHKISGTPYYLINGKKQGLRFLFQKGLDKLLDFDKKQPSSRPSSQ